MTTRHCLTCAYWRQQRTQFNRSSGWCQFSPPTVLLLPGYESPSSHRPETHRSDTCAQHVECRPELADERWRLIHEAQLSIAKG